MAGMSATVKKDLAEAREVCPTTARWLLAEGALLVDVREPEEVARLAFADVPQLHIPLSQFEQRWAEVPRDRDVILACAVGQRSLKATYFLMYHGYDRVMNMQFGMQRWLARGFPVRGDAAAAGQGDGCSCCGTAAATPAGEAGTGCCGG
jgi:rhodanese-related sulfurtransferase